MMAAFKAIDFRVFLLRMFLTDTDVHSFSPQVKLFRFN